MNLLRILIALAILILGALILQFALAPFPVGNTALEIGRSVGRAAGGMVSGLIIWSIIKLFRGQEKAPDISTFVFYTAAVFIVFFTVYDLFLS